MKNELLIRAISHLDDELITEARQPVPTIRNTRRLIIRYVSYAACLIILFTTVFAYFSRSPFTVDINGTDMLTNEIAELALTASMQQRSIFGTEIPLHISVKDTTVTVTPGSGGIILDDSGNEYRSLVISEASDIIWIIDVTLQNTFTFTITLDNGSKTVFLIATVNYDGNYVTVTSQSD